MPDILGRTNPTLNDGDDGFHDWRETFGNQVGSVWLQLDLVSVGLRDEKEEIDSDRFTEMLASTPKLEKPMDAHAADWAFSSVSRRLFSVLDANLNGEAKNI